MIYRFGVVVALAMVFLPAQSWAKGTTIQVSVTGPGLDAPRHLTEPAVTSANVWFGNFADWDGGPVARPDADASPYLLHFWVQFGTGEIEMKYVLTYYWEDASQRALVCLPGQRDLWYSNNVYSIRRKGQDGKCFYAEEDWGAAVHAALP